VLVGSYYRFEIWGPEAWQKTAEEDGQMFGYMLDRIGI
jgi:DNA-binding transcriptional regulator/RsmH inhibitor MraZ